MSQKIGLVGCGAIGTEIARAIDRGDIDAELVAVCDRSSKCVEQLIWSLENKPAKADMIELVNLSDIVVEAASQSAVPMVARAALKKGKSLMIMSVGALANVELYREVKKLAADHGAKVYIRGRKRYYLIVEALGLVLFLAFLLVRFGNPDLWHPWKGGEKPMDFSYFNAILKSTTFQPYDPWFSGGYINYYYYEFILVGVIVKWLGIVPAIAYNLIIPTIFSLIALGAFSIGWNLIGYTSNGARDQGSGINSLKTIVGLAAAIGMAVLGNLGIVRMIYQGYQRLAAPGGNIEAANIITRWIWAVKGAVMAFLGTPLPYGIADWYWNPSRVIPAPNEVEPITEFPFFTVLYGDPHAHLFAMPLALLAISWGLSVLFNRAWRGETGEIPRLSYLQIGVGFILGGLAIGALWPTNRCMPSRPLRSPGTGTTARIRKATIRISRASRAGG